MGVEPTVSAYGGGISSFPVFLNRVMVNYQFDKVERDLANTITTNVKNSPNRRINIQTANEMLPDVIGARKMPNQNALGADSFTDVMIQLAGGRSIKINTKGTIAPMQVHSNARVIFGAAPALTKKFLYAVMTTLKGMGLRDNSLLPNAMPGLYAELRGEHNRKIVMGTPQVGGPIDYMFEGSPFGDYDSDTNTLTLQANLTSARSLAKTTNYYINMAPPTPGSRCMFNKNDNFGMPMVYNNGGRQLSVVDRSYIPSGSNVIRI